MGQPSIQKHHFDGPVLLCTALALGPHLGGALRSVVREKSAGSSRSSRRDLRPDFRRVAPRRAATPLAPNGPKMRAIDRSRPRHFFETKRSPTFFFSAPTFFGKNLPRQHFFLMIFLRKHLSKNVLLCAPPGSPEFVSLKKHADSGTSFFHWDV